MEGYDFPTATNIQPEPLRLCSLPGRFAKAKVRDSREEDSYRSAESYKAAFYS
jgi:hypothetical protein